MKKIDSYILRKYITTFFFCLLLFTAIVVVIDISEKTDDFVKSKLPAWRIMTDYYFGFIPRIDAMLFPLFVFISVIFFTAKMADRSEVVAILSSGVSFRRFLLPYWIGSIFLAGLLWLGYQFVVPKANAIWGNFEATYIDVNFGAVENKVVRQNVYFRIDTNTYAGMRYYDTTVKSGRVFFIQKFSGNQLVYNLRAENITWDTASKKWVMKNVTERFITGQKEEIKRSQSQLITYNFKPIDLKQDEYLKDRLSTPELKQYITKEKLRGSEMVNSLLIERYNRDSIPASVIILTIIGASLSSRKVRGGSGFHIAIGVIISALYILCSRSAVVFAMKGNFTPWLAAWTSNIIFGIVAYYVYKKAPK